jgi:hypothetical protein
MPRAAQVACLFCGEIPCTCNQASKPKATRPRVAPKTAARPVEDINLPKEEVFDLSEGPRTRFKEKAQQTEVVNQDDLEMRTAIQNLIDCDMLSAETRAKLRFQGLIDQPHSAKVEKRLFDWRRRRAEG